MDDGAVEESTLRREIPTNRLKMRRISFETGDRLAERKNGMYLDANDIRKKKNVQPKMIKISARKITCEVIQRVTSSWNWRPMIW